jgi:hypothetical protein
MRFDRLSRRGLLTLVACSVLARGGRAAGLPAPTHKPILTVSGKIGIGNRPGAADFDIAMLERLGTASFETTTPWFTGPVTFEGVPMARLMAEVGASGEQVAVVALNDYSSVIPVEDFERYGVLLALKRNGEYMPVRDKGPLFVVYPYDSYPELKSQRFYSRSVWQVKRLEVR